MTAAVPLVALSGCAPEPEPVGTFVNLGGNGLAVQLTLSPNGTSGAGYAVKGVLQVAELDPAATSEVVESVSEVQGVVPLAPPGRFDLILTRPIDALGHLRGSYSGGGFDVDLRGLRTPITSVALVRDPPQTYAEELAMLHSISESAMGASQNAAAMQQQMAAAQHSVIDNEAASVRRDLSALQTDVATLRSAVAAFPQLLDPVHQDMLLAQTEDQWAQHSGQSSAGGSNACPDAASAQANARQAAFQATDVLHPSGLELLTVDEDLRSLTAAATQLRTVLAETPSYRPAGLPTRAEVDAATAAAQGVEQQARALPTPDQTAAVNHDVTAAQQAAADAERICQQNGGH